ncbi:MAG TPA: DNA-processing protein DprA [Solimonas sp.]
MNTDALLPWLRLLRTPGIGPATFHRLLSASGAAAALGDAAWLRAAGLEASLLRAWREVSEAELQRDLAWLSGAQRHVLTLDDPRYPAQLREIPAPPPLLFVQGDPELLALPQIALVGARTATPQGLENAEAFAAELTRRGFVVTSGLALGIDGAAHRGALAADGYTVAVCATGLDRVYPARHKALAQEIATRGALVSEFPTGVQALAEHFPRRNRLISGLSMGVLVVEAAQQSGSLITARLALEQGREVLAIPGSIHNPMARGCHALIRQGAKLVETVDDILVELGPLLGAHPARRAAASASASAGAAPTPTPEADERLAGILRAMGDETLTLDELVSRSTYPVAAVQAALMMLELDGRIAPAPGGRYQRLRRR